MQTKPPPAPPSMVVLFRDVNLKKSESSLTMYNITVLKKRSRDSSVTEPTESTIRNRPLHRTTHEHTEKVMMELQQQRVKQSEASVQFFNGCTHLSSIHG
ncbi:hypothetical protein VNO78_19671 [Psophocarpus tetragonolobus]|uniref:Uncharacterized protein n=1 Tax=Psophocarpus tetragonolobus TaxID=3891 RepID=A0AAN9S7Y7_PSOTE